MKSKCQFSFKKNKNLEIFKPNLKIDLYTGQVIDTNDKIYYQVDHVFEIQCFAYVIASALYKLDDGRSIFDELKNEFIEIINTNKNLNVTDNTTNLVKMNVFRDYIKKRRYDSRISLIQLLQVSRFDKCIAQFCRALR